MRPQGEVRLALRAAVYALAPEVGPVNFRQAAAAANVGAAVAQVTLNNMARAGDVVVAGHERAAGTSHYFTLYAPPGPDDGQGDVPEPWGGIERLAQVMHTFPAGELSDA